MLFFYKTIDGKYIPWGIGMEVTAVPANDFSGIKITDSNPSTPVLPESQSSESAGVTSEAESSQSDRVLQQRPRIVPPLNFKDLLSKQNDEQQLLLILPGNPQFTSRTNESPRAEHSVELLSEQVKAEQPAESLNNELISLKKALSCLLSNYINSRKSSPFFYNKALTAEKTWLANGLLEHINQAESMPELLQSIRVIIQKNQVAEEKFSRLPTFFARKQNDGGDLGRALMAMERSIPKA